MALSGLQRSVFSLYRKCLRQVGKKPAENQHNFLDYVRSEFREHAKLDKKDFATVEYLMRRGNSQLEMYSSPGIKNVHR